MSAYSGTWWKDERRRTRGDLYGTKQEAEGERNEGKGGTVEERVKERESVGREENQGIGIVRS